ncbi:MAG: alcohol dehydrogenase catalytic domain-containing protein [Desulfobulbaceae bacterium]|nr:alcohol dehydrogenase catalytic domain-containing protein [Desulfobulbaceae bacterium]
MQLFLNGPGLVDFAEHPCALSPFLEVKACGICHSDRKAFRTPPRGMKFPRVLGHEVCGILSVDLPGQHLKAGDKVAIWPALSCGNCSFCLSGRHNLCPEIRLFGYHLDGGFSGHIHLPEHLTERVVCFRLPSSLSFQQAVLAEPLGCILNGLEKFPGTPNSILILGAGLMGRLCCRASRFFWPQAKIFISDTSPERTALAASDAETREMQMADLVFIAASDRDAFYNGLAFLSPGGSITLFSGFPRQSENITVNHNELHRKEQAFYGAYGCLAHHIEQALALMADGSIKVDDLITGLIPLRAADRELAREQKATDYKTVIYFD